MEPWQLGSRLLPNFKFGAFFCKKSHIFEIATGKPLHIWKGSAQVSGSPLNDLGTPPLPTLSLQNITPNVVIKAYLFLIGRK
jgi:hypothetical protein